MSPAEKMVPPGLQLLKPNTYLTSYLASPPAIAASSISSFPWPCPLLSITIVRFPGQVAIVSNLDDSNNLTDLLFILLTFFFFSWPFLIHLLATIILEKCKSYSITPLFKALWCDSMQLEENLNFSLWPSGLLTCPTSCLESCLQPLYSLTQQTYSFLMLPLPGTLLGLHVALSYLLRRLPLKCHPFTDSLI